MTNMYIYIYNALLVQVKTIYKMHGAYIKINLSPTVASNWGLFLKDWDGKFSPRLHLTWYPWPVSW